MSGEGALDRAIEAALEAGVPAVALCVVGPQGTMFERYAGSAAEQAVDARSLFDLASVTKAACTTTLAAVLTARGLLDLDMPVRRALPTGLDVTARQLLHHESGLEAWRPLFLDAAEKILGGVAPRPREFRKPRQRMRRAILEQQPGARRGERVYSDLGFMLLGLLLEELGRDPLDRLFLDLVARPLGLEDELRFFDLAAGDLPFGLHVVPTGSTRPRQPAPGQEDLIVVPAQEPRLDPGEVDDDNAWAMGGVAGHAGLFGSARALTRLGRALIDEAEGADVLGAGEVLRTWFAPAARGERCLGWDRPEGDDSLAGTRLGRGPKGGLMHLGFTGTSLILDLDRSLSIALLTNRTLPGRQHLEPIRTLRRAVHDAVADLP